MSMLNLIVPQFMAVLKQSGFDGEKVQADIVAAVNDIRAMKESQDRCEAMIEYLALRQGYDSWVAENKIKLLGHSLSINKDAAE
jgi:NADH:ubiquinone oxidoreductase subunit E